MSKSSPRPSPSAAKTLASEAAARRAVANDSSTPRPHHIRKFSNRLAAFMRWLHIYLSLFGLFALLFFSVTGITLNHPDWFFNEAEKSVQSEGKINPAWLRLKSPEPVIDSQNSDDETRHVARLEIVEFLRKTHAVRGALSEIKADDRECTVTFKGPGYAADAFIDRDSGDYKITQTYHGFIAVINDLHKGRDTGTVWSIVIDLSAVVMTLVSITGVIILFWIKRRRVSGMITALVGTIVVLFVIWRWVP